MNRGVSVVAAGVTLTLACSLITPLDGLTGSAAPCAGCVDGGSPLDAGTDAAVTDAGNAEAAGDARSDGGDSAPLPFCANFTVPPKLCADFDTGSFSARFSSVDATGTATLRADSAAFISPGQALLSALPVSGLNADFAFMTGTFVNASATTARYAFDLRVDGWATGAKTGIFASIVINASLPGRHVLSLYVTDSSAGLEESFFDVSGTQQFSDHPLSAHPSLGVWVHVTFDLNLTDRTCSAALDGAAALPSTALNASWIAGEPSADLGIKYVASEASAWSVRYDNVVFDWN